MTGSGDDATPGPAPGPDWFQGDMALEYADRGPRRFIPGYDASHVMAAVLLRERLADEAEILVVGAGGGVELAAFALEYSSWRFTGVDPSPDMLQVAQAALQRVGAADRATLVEGYVDDAPAGPFDAATAFLALHFIPDDGRRLDALLAIRARLKPGGRFLMISGCADRDGPDFERDLGRYVGYARRMGALEEDIDRAVKALRAGELSPLPRAREEALMREAGFGAVETFYQGFWVMGWVADAM